MADKTIIEADVKSNIGEVADGLDRAATNTEKLKGATEKAGGGFKKLGGTIKGVGVALKAAGIGLVVALVAKLMEVFSKNQKVLDVFNTAMTSLSIAFNDLFSFLSNNVGKVTGWFKSIFDDPVQSLKDFGTAIKENLIERFDSLLETFGHLGKSLGHLFKGEFAEAWDSVKDAGKEYVDVLTGVDNSVDKITETVKNATTAIVDYTKSTIDQAKAITETQKAADRAAVEFAKLNAQYLKDAEIQRQIRDDETKTFAERIEANNKLNDILAEQQKLQREQVQIGIDAAQQQYNINASEENWIALQEQKVAMLELEETITGQLSEQKTNAVALEKELLEAQREIAQEGLSGIEKELLELENAYKLKKDMARKSGIDTTAIDEQYAKQKSAIVQAQVNSQLEAFSGLAGALGSLAGESKELAIAQAVIDTYVGANKAFAQGGVVGFVSAAAVIAAGLANVQKIMQTDVGGTDNSTPPPAVNQPPAPQMMSGAFDISGGIAPEASRAYVVTDEMSNSQNQLANIRRRATI